MTHSRRAISILAFLALLLPACNEELGPLNEPSGFAGVIRFRNWPALTDIHEMRLVAFEEVPTDSAGILPMLIAGKAAVYPPLGQDYFQAGVDSVEYEFTEKSGTNLKLKTYPYVAVMYQYGPSILTQWRPGGVYSNGPGPFDPAPLRVLLHRVQRNVDFLVDFNNLPPPPWR